MQDYAKMWPHKYEKLDADEQIRRIKKVLKSRLSPLLLLAAIIMIIRLGK